MNFKVVHTFALPDVDLGEELLEPTKIYSETVRHLLRDFPIHGMAHITGGGIVDNQKLAQMLEDNGYEGFLAVEIDFLHPDYNNDEDRAVADSIRELKRIARAVEK